MELGQANDLLNPGYLPFESGYRDLTDGKRLVAALTRMPGCRAKMVHWWFSWLGGTEQYKLWHPRDHIFSDLKTAATAITSAPRIWCMNISPGRAAPCTSCASIFAIRQRCSTRAAIARPAWLRSARASAISNIL